MAPPSKARTSALCRDPNGENRPKVDCCELGAATYPCLFALENAGVGLVASFANGVVRDRAAVSAAITSPWFNGQKEGQITKLKLVKRQIYGRGKIDLLLQARVIGAG